MSPAAPASRASKILVIDDNPIIQRTLFFALRDCGYQVFICGELTESLNLARKELPNLILLDIHFPPDPSIISGGVRDGYSALAFIHRQEGLKEVPIVIISSDDPASAKPRALATGAAAYLHKPIAKEVLIQTVAELLNHHLLARTG
jgi:CheY-like chemotaxis protein